MGIHNHLVVVVLPEHQAGESIKETLSDSHIAAIHFVAVVALGYKPAGSQVKSELVSVQHEMNLLGLLVAELQYIGRVFNFGKIFVWFQVNQNLVARSENKLLVNLIAPVADYR